MAAAGRFLLTRRLVCKKRGARAKGRGASHNPACYDGCVAVIPLTLSISLVLVVIFLGFFLREHARSRRSGPERDSLLPLAEETARLAGSRPAPPIPHHPPL